MRLRLHAILSDLSLRENRGRHGERGGINRRDRCLNQWTSCHLLCCILFFLDLCCGLNVPVTSLRHCLNNLRNSIIQSRCIRTALCLLYPTSLSKLPYARVYHPIILFVRLLGSHTASDDGIKEERGSDGAVGRFPAIELSPALEVRE
jgi:hypothetical protein